MRCWIFLILFLIACSKQSPYQKSLDEFFSKGNSDYEPIELNNLDTTTLQEFREVEFRLAQLRASPPLKAQHENLDSLYSELIKNGWADDFVIERYKVNTGKLIEFIYLEKTRDSLAALLNGYDKDLPYDIRGDYRFRLGNDTFEYHVIFNPDLTIQEAIKQ